MVSNTPSSFTLPLTLALVLMFVSAGIAQSTNGTWVDPMTGLMWTTEDNNSKVSWNQANRYCAQLTTGGFDDWRLPSLAELLKRRAPSATWTHNLKAPIALQDPSVWSATASPTGYFSLNFLHGQWHSEDADFASSAHVLCVRPVSMRKG
jgi:Protein of unknown function (DUF1566)